MTTKQTPCPPCVSETTFDKQLDMVRASDGRTGFQHQVVSGSRPVAELMADGAFKPEMMWVKDADGLNALDLAALHTDVNTVKSMIESIADKEACLKSVFYSIEGNTLEAFANLITLENVNRLRDHNDNSLLMRALIHRSYRSVVTLIETLHFTNFMHVRQVDRATALHLIACLRDAPLANYVLDRVGQEMADAIGMTADPGNYNALHFLCRYASLDVFFMFVNKLADFSGFDEACGAKSAIGSQPAQLALIFDSQYGPEKAYVLESITPMDPIIYNHKNIVDLVATNRAKTWLATGSLGYNVSE